MDKLLKKPVKDCMTTTVITVTPEENIKTVFQLMDTHGIFGLPVVDADNHVVGMVTESDLIRHFTTLKTPRGIHILGSIVYLDDIHDFNDHLKEHCAETVGELMNTDLIAIEETSTLLDALNRMSENDVNRLPVTNKSGKLCGILTRKDIVHQLAQLKNI
jgi:CBS domain-containing protein